VQTKLHPFFAGHLKSKFFYIGFLSHFKDTNDSIVLNAEVIPAFQIKSL
jgi:hypothetical protein